MTGAREGDDERCFDLLSRTNGRRSHSLGDAERNDLLLQDLEIISDIVDVAFRFSDDGRHALHRVERVVARRGFAGKHHGIRAVEDGVRDVRRFGASRTRSTGHGLQHLRRGDDGLTRVVASLDHALLSQEDLLHADFHTQVTAGDHDAVGLLDDVIEVVQTLQVFNLGDDAHPARKVAEDFANVFNIAALAHEGRSDEVHVVLHRKKPVYTEEQTLQLAAYVASLSPGPAIPNASQLNWAGADLAKGGELFRANCAQCHSFSGRGGALTEGKYAPTLMLATPQQIYEAMITGPQAMPIFNDQTLNLEEKQAVLAYIEYLKDSPNPGGLELGRYGPVTEGLFLWTVGIGALLMVAIWIGVKAK